MRINWLAVLISAIIVVLLRHLWYAHFGGADWAALPTRVVDDIRGDTTLAGKELVNALVLCLTLGWVVDAMRNRSMFEGLATGIAVAVGFGLTSISSGLIHGEPVESFLIDGGFLVAAYLIAGAIIGAMAPKRSTRSKFNWSGSEAPAEH
jgi:hypothetical protein